MPPVPHQSAILWYNVKVEDYQSTILKTWFSIMSYFKQTQ